MSLLKETYYETELPYDRFVRFGAESLSDAELLAIMVRTGTRTKTPVELGREILSLSGKKWGLLGLHHFKLNDLIQISGIGEVKAIQLLCVAEIAKRMSRMQAESNLSFDNPQSVADCYMEKMRHQSTERLLLLLLDNKRCLINEIILSLGTINATMISAREVFIQAMKHEASYIMILHNHPSGDPTPSKYDIAATQKIKEVSDLVEIPLLDHIIIGDNKSTSFNEKGLL